MREAGDIVARAMINCGKKLQSGVTTGEVDNFLREFIEKEGAKPAFLGLYGFPATACISINEEIVHGIPGERKLLSGDLISIDCGAIVGGMYSDHARTFIIEDSSDEDKNKLISVADNALQIGIKNSIAGNKIGIISNSIEEYVLGQGFDVVREYVGHGIGSQLHEPPSVPNFGKKNEGALLRVGMAIAIEPMVTEGKWQTKVMDDKWTVVTKDGKLSSHFEDTILITEDGPEILTKASI
ncbi:MAG: type I methionyl aminopeptidase [Chloroflexi bacterium]|jgi:methionyl aminopeptidase|nr:type I methionyl aminopeptidase [Chloroflexota bacterium]MBP05414.1 type I methionyl aminopeptidase [Chloroflexota bacterium]OUW95954.1 MAG: type I methionyl aminopeptidase [Chloroflexi bacterium TMED230]RZP13113.1 MAG: type I methionyl aminopeptidase [Chloroflexota bacterium]|tara:strand:- start:8042 stop:8761 length:720 start_codon:yes stop_codon:yes gene_type:complete